MIDSLRERVCERKVRYSRKAAMGTAARMRRSGKERDRGVSAYRCPFGDGDEHWHVGHAPTLDALEQLAAAIRARQAGHGLGSPA